MGEVLLFCLTPHKKRFIIAKDLDIIRHMAD